MLRELQTTLNKPANSMYKATADTQVGMAVTKTESTKSFAVTSAITTAGIYFVDKDFYPQGIYASINDFSDYDTKVQTVKTGERAKLIAFYPGEVFATDQIDSTLISSGNIVSTLAAGTQIGFKAGKVISLASGSTSKYVFQGQYNDCGHVLAKIEVVE